MKATVKRNNRTYKVADKYYDKATRRAKKEKQLLAQVIEVCVMAYGNKDLELYYIDVHGNKQVITGSDADVLKNNLK